MAAYKYLALNASGREEKGILEADSVRQVRQLLRDKGLTPLDVDLTRQKEAKPSGGLSPNRLLKELFSPRMSVGDRALVTRQLATLISAGLPVAEALLAVSRQSDKPAIQSMMLTIRASVMEGYSLAESFADFPRAFPQLHRATVAAGESSGHLALVLARLADFTEAQQAASARMAQALVYPIILLALTALILAGLLGYVVPDLVEVFADAGQELPWLTKAIIVMSDLVVDYGIVTLLALLALIFLCRRALQLPQVRLALDRQLLSWPVFGKLARGTGMAQFASTLSMLSASGVPLVDALKIAGRVLSNTWLQKQVLEATHKVSEGSSLASALERSDSFPPMMLHLIASGEASGALDDMLARLAKHQQNEAEVLMGVLLSLFGPLMLILMGGAVFTIVMAILLPIINLNQLVL